MIKLTATLQHDYSVFDVLKELGLFAACQVRAYIGISRNQWHIGGTISGNTSTRLQPSDGNICVLQCKESKCASNYFVIT